MSKIQFRCLTKRLIYPKIVMQQIHTSYILLTADSPWKARTSLAKITPFRRPSSNSTTPNSNSSPKQPSIHCCASPTWQRYSYACMRWRCLSAHEPPREREEGVEFERALGAFRCKRPGSPATPSTTAGWVRSCLSTSILKSRSRKDFLSLRRGPSSASFFAVLSPPTHLSPLTMRGRWFPNLRRDPADNASP